MIITIFRFLESILNSMTEQEKINKECYDLILRLKALGNNLADDVATAEYMGLEDHNFSEQDLNKLKEIFDHFCKAYNKIPDFENIIRWDFPI